MIENLNSLELWLDHHYLNNIKIFNVKKSDLIFNTNKKITEGENIDYLKEILNKTSGVFKIEGISEYDKKKYSTYFSNNIEQINEHRSRFYRLLDNFFKDDNYNEQRDINSTLIWNLLKGSEVVDTKIYKAIQFLKDEDKELILSTINNIIKVSKNAETRSFALINRDSNTIQ